MTDLIFRPALRADVPAIVGLLADDPIGAGRETVAEEVDAAYWQAFDAIDADPRNTLVVADLAGEVVGTMQLTFIPSLTRRGAERLEIEGVRVARRPPRRRPRPSDDRVGGRPRPARAAARWSSSPPTSAARTRTGSTSRSASPRPTRA